MDTFRKYSDFTPLNTTPDHVFTLAQEKFTTPVPLRKYPDSRDRTKFCEFHQDHDHLTGDCFQLRRQIEILIQDDDLKEFIIRMVD